MLLTAPAAPQTVARTMVRSDSSCGITSLMNFKAQREARNVKVSATNSIIVNIAVTANLLVIIVIPSFFARYCDSSDVGGRTPGRVGIEGIFSLIRSSASEDASIMICSMSSP